MLGLRKGFWVAGPVVVLGLVTCADLSTVQANLCGNGVVDYKEDCDPGSVNTSTTCGAPGQIGACQYLCRHDGSLACPDGFKCGVDNLCRQPFASSWTAGATVVQPTARDLLVADFDGDGVDDVVAVTTDAIELHYFESTRVSTDTTSITAPDARPSAGVLHGVASTTNPGKYPPSLVLDVSHGLGVFTGVNDRTLLPKPFATVSVTSGQVYVAPFVTTAVDSGTNTVTGVQTDVFVYDNDQIYVYQPPFQTGATKVPYPMGDKPVGLGIVADFDRTITASSRCEELALTLDNVLGRHVSVWSPCKTPKAITRTADIVLPGGAMPCTNCQPLHLADVDGDGDPDLVIVDSTYKLYAAFSDGKGTFGGIMGPNGLYTVAATPLPLTGLTLTSPPLAVGDLNGDCVLDVVEANQIDVSDLGVGAAAPDQCSRPDALTGSKGYSSFTFTEPNHPWHEAHVADMNADGRPDVIVTFASDPNITVYRGTSSAIFDPVTIATNAPIQNLAVGDYDGDLVPDIVFSDKGVSLDTVSISFGSASGPPTTPTVIGQVPTVGEVMPMPLQVLYGSADGALAASYDADGGTEVYLFASNPYREMVAPYVFLQQDQSIDLPVRSVVGSFTGRQDDDMVPLADIAAYATSATCPPQMSCDPHLWLLQMQANGSIQVASKLVPTTFTGTFKSADNVLLANLGPPAKGQNDVLAMAAPVPPQSNQKPTTTALLVMSASSSSTAFQPPGAESPIPYNLSDITTNRAQLLAANVTNAARRDVVLASPNGGLAVVPWNGTSFSTPLSWTAGQLLAPCGMPSSATSTTLRVAALPPDASGMQTLVAVLSNAIVLVKQGSSGFQITCLEETSGGDVMPEPDGGAADAGPDAGASTVPTGGTAVAVGDLDGDGIPDIVVSRGNGLAVYYGDALEPGGVPPKQGSYADGGAQ